MKIKNKIIILLILMICLFDSSVYANFAAFYANKLDIKISNINDSISKIELLAVESANPTSVFDYITQKSYGYYYDDIGREVIIWDKNDIVTDKRNDRIHYYKDTEKQVYLREREEQFYLVTDVNDKEYIFFYTNEKGDSLFNPVYHTLYYDSNKDTFTLYKIVSTNEIKHFKIKNGSFEISINDLDLYGRKDRDYKSKEKVPNFYLRFYKNDGSYKDVAIGTNELPTTIYEKVASIGRTFDYQTGKLLAQKSQKRTIEKTITLVEEIGVCILFTLIIELIVAKFMKITDYKTIIKVNIITQILFHLVFLIPQTFFNISLVSFIGMLFYNLIEQICQDGNNAYIVLYIVSVGVIEIAIILIEYIKYKKAIKDEPKEKLLNYSFLANLASYAVSVAFFLMCNISLFNV